MYSHVFGRPFGDVSAASQAAAMSISDTAVLLNTAHCVVQAIQTGTAPKAFTPIAGGAATWFANIRSRTVRRPSNCDAVPDNSIT